MFLLWPAATACSSSITPASTALVAAARCSGSMRGLAGAGAAASAAGASPRAARSSLAHSGTGGSGAAASCAAATACARAGTKAFHTAFSWLCAASSWGGKRTSTLGHWPSACSAAAWSCQCATSACSASCCCCASAQGLVDRSSMRCASRAAASRCTITRCCRSSTALMRSTSCVRRPASGSRDSGAPALAASRCQARASAMFRRAASSRAWALACHSAATASWPLARRSSSSFSRSALAAPLSLADSSLNTSCICSGVGSVASQSRTRWARSPEVAAENTPPVSASSGCASGTLGAGASAAACGSLGSRLKGNMRSQDERWTWARAHAGRAETIYCRCNRAARGGVTASRRHFMPRLNSACGTQPLGAAALSALAALAGAAAADAADAALAPVCAAPRNRRAAATPLPTR